MTTRLNDLGEAQKYSILCELVAAAQSCGYQKIAVPNGVWRWIQRRAIEDHARIGRELPEGGMRNLYFRGVQVVSPMHQGVSFHTMPTQPPECIRDREVVLLQRTISDNFLWAAIRPKDGELFIDVYHPDGVRVYTDKAKNFNFVKYRVQKHPRNSYFGEQLFKSEAQ